jgi:glycosyltransferase involved in cell wall biosynthesis
MSSGAQPGAGRSTPEEPIGGDTPIAPAVTGAPVRVFADIARPQSQPLIDAIRRLGSPARGVYRRPPLAEEESWAVTLGDDDMVTGSGRRERREWRAAAGCHVVFAGPQDAQTGLERRLAASRRARTVHVWGERLAPEPLVVHALRRAYYGPWYLDGILAVGTRAVDSYRAVTGRDVPVHVLPYVTDRGLHVRAVPALRPTIGFSGRLVAAKGVLLLLRALARLPASERPRLQVVGDGPEGPALHTRATRLGIDRWVDWLGDLDEPRLDLVRARWWAQVVPSRRPETWGIVVHRALNSGVPVIASSHVHAATDLVRSGHNGAIVPGDDPERWAHAIRQLIDPDVQAAYGQAARDIGRAFAPVDAARWLLDLLAAAERARRDGRRPQGRSFVEHAWAHLVPAEHRERTAP